MSMGVAFPAAWTWEKLDFRVVCVPYGDLKLAYVAPPVDNGFSIELIPGPGAAERAPYEDLGEVSTVRAGTTCVSWSTAPTTASPSFRRRGVKIVAEPFDLADISRRLAFFGDPWRNLYGLAQILG